MELDVNVGANGIEDHGEGDDDGRDTADRRTGGAESTISDDVEAGERQRLIRKLPDKDPVGVTCRCMV